MNRVRISNTAASPNAHMTTITGISCIGSFFRENKCEYVDECEFMDRECSLRTSNDFSKLMVDIKFRFSNAKLDLLNQQNFTV